MGNWEFSFKTPYGSLESNREVKKPKEEKAEVQAETAAATKVESKKLADVLQTKKSDVLRFFDTMKDIDFKTVSGEVDYKGGKPDFSGLDAVLKVAMTNRPDLSSFKTTLGDSFTAVNDADLWKNLVEMRVADVKSKLENKFNLAYSKDKLNKVLMDLGKTEFKMKVENMEFVLPEEVKKAMETADTEAEKFEREEDAYEKKYQALKSSPLAGFLTIFGGDEILQQMARGEKGSWFYTFLAGMLGVEGFADDYGKIKAKLPPVAQEFLAKVEVGLKAKVNEYMPEDIKLGAFLQTFQAGFAQKPLEKSLRLTEDFDFAGHTVDAVTVRTKAGLLSMPATFSEKVKVQKINADGSIGDMEEVDKMSGDYKILGKIPKNTIFPSGTELKIEQKA